MWNKKAEEEEEEEEEEKEEERNEDQDERSLHFISRSEFTAKNTHLGEKIASKHSEEENQLKERNSCGTERRSLEDAGFFFSRLPIHR